MPNPIKYTTGSGSLALKKGNFLFGTGDVGKGPSDTTGYYQAVDVPKPGYVVYQYLDNVPGNLTYATFTGDTEFINFTNGLAGQTFTSTTQCLVYYRGQSDKVCFNRDYEPIITDGLILNVDAGFDGSYPESGTTFTDLSLSGNNSTLVNSPTYYANGGGGIVFDGIDDRITLTNNIKQTGSQTISFWFYPTSWTFGGVFEPGLFGGFSFGSNNTKGGIAISRYDTFNKFWVDMYSSNARATTSISLPSLNSWNNIVITYERSTGTLTTYLNSSFVGSASFPTPSDIDWSNVPTPTLGAAYLNGEYLRFKGSISGGLFYNRALSSSEVLQNYNALKDRFAFIFTVDTTKTGVSTSTQFKLPLVSSGSINFVVEWGDGTSDTITTFNQAETTHTYPSGGVYEIKIRGVLKGWQFNSGGDRLKMGVIKNWGCFDISVNSGFFGCGNMTCIASDAPTISSTDLGNYFRDCGNFNGAIGNWNVSNVTSLFAMFYGASSFKNPLNNWNVSKVQNFGALFVFTPYNSPLNNWDTSSATNMGEMFNVANSFNQDIGNWNVSKNTSMYYMFRGCPFNKDISNWDVSKVTTMQFAFSQSSFNQNIGSWNVSNVTDFSAMFRQNSVFNNGESPSISGWTTSAATTFNNMFRGASKFNQPIGSWDTRNVTDIGLMFEGANSFNQNIGTWDTSKFVGNALGRSLRSGSFNNGGSPDINNWNLSGITALYGVFWDASLFNQPIKDWNITGVTTATNFFTSGSQYSTANYDDILNTWSQKDVRTGVTINFASIKYSSAGAAARATLVNTYGWTITDGGQV